MNSEAREGSPLALVSVFICAAGFAASLTCVFLGMREIMQTVGAACASGGPYVVAAECPEGATTLLIGGIFAMLLFGGLLFPATTWQGNVSTLGVAFLMWGVLFGALGYNFIELSINPPEFMTSTSGWVVSGVVFWAMALGGLIPGAIAIFNSMRGRDEFGEPEEATQFKAPIVRANVHFERNMPGDPAHGMSDPNEIIRAQTAQATQSSQGAPTEQAPMRQVDTADEFVDPVTGEKIRPGGSDA